jgi:hypothetical protein
MNCIDAMMRQVPSRNALKAASADSGCRPLRDQRLLMSEFA